MSLQVSSGGREWGGRMNTKIFLIILASAFGLIIFSAIVGGVLESSGKLTVEAIGSTGITAIKIYFFALFCIMCFTLVPIFIRLFIVMQIKIGNGEFFLIKWFQENEQGIIYGFWSLIVIGLCLSIPVAIKDGFFK